MKAHAVHRSNSVRASSLGFSLLCVVSAIFISTSSLIAQTNQWLGIDTVWTDTANWTNGVPTATSKIIISVGSSGYRNPYVPPPESFDTARTGDLTVQNGAKLHFVNTPPGILVVSGTISLLNNASIDLGDGIMILNDNTQLNGGIFNADSGTITLAGSQWAFNSGATFDAGTSTVVLQGTGNQTISGDVTFYNLIINTPDTVTIAGSVTVGGNLTVASGATVNVPSGDSLTVNGTVTNYGSIVGGGTFPLPVEMVSIWASEKKEGVELKWTTATEVNNFGFDVERKSSGTEWTKIGFVAGAGTSSSLHNYSFTDNSSGPGLIDYRVKQIDRDGSFKYSTIVQIEVAGIPRVLSLGSNYPNPFNPTTTIEFAVPQDGRATLKVYNILGQEVATLFDGVATAARSYKVIFDASQLASGVFFSRLESSGQAIVKRMVLMK